MIGLGLSHNAIFLTQTLVLSLWSMMPKMQILTNEEQWTKNLHIAFTTPLLCLLGKGLQK